MSIRGCLKGACGRNVTSVISRRERTNFNVEINLGNQLKAHGRAFSVSPTWMPCFGSKNVHRHFATSSANAAKNDDQHYQTLGVSREATAEEIKAAFIELSKLHHPDVSQSDTALKDFLKIRDAYEILGNAAKKREYDRTLKKKEPDVVEDMFPEGMEPTTLLK